jgi:hypothetical protein
VDCAAVRQCGNVRQYERQCVAVRTAAVCGSALLGNVWQCARQCAAVRQCGSVQQCAAVCSGVRQCARLHVCKRARGGARQCVGLYVAVFGSKHGSVRAMRAMRAVRAAVCGSTIAVVCGSAWQCVVVPAYCAIGVWQCALHIYILHKVAHNLHSVTGAVGMSLIFFAY